MRIETNPDLQKPINYDGESDEDNMEAET